MSMLESDLHSHSSNIFSCIQMGSWRGAIKPTDHKRTILTEKNDAMEKNRVQILFLSKHVHLTSQLIQKVNDAQSFFSASQRSKISGKKGFIHDLRNNT